MRQIGPIAADRCGDRFAGFGMHADFARQGQQFQRPFQIEFGNILGNRGTLGLLAVAQLHIGPEPPGAARDLQPRCGIHTQHRIVAASAVIAILPLGEFARIFAFGIVRARHKRAVTAAAQAQAPGAAFRADAWIGAVGARGEQIIGQERVQLGGHFAGLAFHHFVGFGFEIAPECSQHVFPHGAPAGHVIKFLFHAGGELVRHIAVEKAFKKRCQQTPGFFCKETVFFNPHVIAVLDHLDRRGICRRAPDPEFLKPFDQRGFGIAWRRLGEVLRGIDPALGRQIAAAHRGQQRAVFVVGVGLLIATFFIDRQEAWKAHNLAGGAQFVFAGAFAQGDSGAFQAGRGHLAGQRAFPDQLVKPRLVARTVVAARKFSGPDCFMRFLSILGLGLVNTWFFGQVMPVIAVGDDPARIRNGRRVHLHPVGAHIGDRACFIQRLGDAHGVAGGKAQLARGFLLQG